MSGFNRNIFTPTDVANYNSSSVGTPATMDSSPPAGAAPATPGAAAVPPTTPVTPPAAGQPSTPATPTAVGGVPVPVPDGYLTKLLKYVPLEVLGAYLFIEGLVTTNVKEASALQAWLFWVLLLSVAVSIVYMRVVLGVVRTTQNLMGAVGIAVYVFATGGWFSTMDWYQEWYSSIALAAFAMLVGVIKLPNLPVTPAQATT